MRRQKINKISSLYYVVEVRRTTKITKQKPDVCVFKVEVCLKILSTVRMETIPEKTALEELGECAMARAEEKESKATGIKAIACLVSLRNST